MDQRDHQHPLNLRIAPFGARAPSFIATAFLLALGTSSAEGVPAAPRPNATEAIELSEVGRRIPYFARRYGTRCSTCHVLPPKLNELGEEFLARGYRFPTPRERSRTIPVAVWASTRADWLSGPEQSGPFVNRVELISGGPLNNAWSYFVEWRAVSFGTRSDGTLRDRSGRFEDLFVQGDVARGILLMIGQFRLLSQVDVSRRLWLSEPGAFSVSLPGDPATSSRLTSLRGFSQSGRSPALRLQVQVHRGPDPARIADGWFAVGNLAFPGEFSIPLTDEARENASLEFEEVPKGVFIETYYRRGLSSVGIHSFIGDGRWLAGAIGAYRSGPWFSTLAVTVAHRGTSLGRWTWGNEWIPNPWAGVGLRIEDRAGDGLDPALAPYVTAHFPGTRYTIRGTAEYRLQPGRPAAAALELATVF